jgi:hypothetical protein
MNTLVNLFATGRIVIYILALLVVEAVVLIAASRMAGKALRPLDLIVSLLAGAGLLLALRGALIGDSWPKIAPWLVVALCAHLLDVIRRWTAA